MRAALHLDKSSSARVLAIQVIDFAGTGAARWRRTAPSLVASKEDLVFAKAMTPIGSRASAGFGAGLPDLRRQVLLTAWRRPAAFTEFLKSSFAHWPGEGIEHSGWVVCEVVSTRGSYRGAKPLEASAPPNPELPFAALTLGQTRTRSLHRFLREGARLGPFVGDAPGLVTAFSAGLPLTGNCTVSLWRSEHDMHAFAYGNRDGHGVTIRRNPPILAEQLNARLQVLEIGGEWGPETMHRDRLQQLT